MHRIPVVRRMLRGLPLVVVALWLGLAPQQAPAADAVYPDDADKFSQEELAQMLGPIALYPDRLLSQILMASTYPIEVVEADRWVKKNPKLEGEALDRALLDRDWDPSVKALTHFPAILALMSERLTETTNLGNAFLIQEAEVMDMIQELRARAYAQGNLVTTTEQKVIVEKETIIIEPANPRVIYVPYYDPFYVYGPWWYPAYPPYYWGPSGIRVSLGFGISFLPGIYFGFSFGDWYYFDWPRRYIYIYVHERPRYVRHDQWYAKPGRWVHSPVHRRGVAYRDKYTATKFGQYSHRTGEYRGDVRGFPERRTGDQGLRRPGGGRSAVEQVQPVENNVRYERSRQEQQRIERELQRQPQEPRQRPQQNGTVERERRQRQEQTGSGEASRERERIERELQRRQQAEPPRQERTGVDRPSRGRERIEGEQPVRQRPAVEQRGRDEIERGRSGQGGESLFEPRDNGRNERQFSERGQSSRQERGDVHRNQGRGGDGNANGRDDEGRFRR